MYEGRVDLEEFVFDHLIDCYGLVLCSFIAIAYVVNTSHHSPHQVGTNRFDLYLSHKQMTNPLRGTLHMLKR